MSTHGTILRSNHTGVYHHFDSYPNGLGRALWNLLHGHFKGDTKAMLKVLIDEHSAGWSTIVDSDFSMSPGYTNGGGERDNRPACYCHGDRHQNPMPMSGLCEEYNYVFSSSGDTMRIHFMNNTPYVVDLRGEEPDWKWVDEHMNRENF